MKLLLLAIVALVTAPLVHVDHDFVIRSGNTTVREHLVCDLNYEASDDLPIVSYQSSAVTIVKCMATKMVWKSPTRMFCSGDYPRKDGTAGTWTLELYQSPNGQDRFQMKFRDGYGKVAVRRTGILIGRRPVGAATTDMAGGSATGWRMTLIGPK